MRCGEIFSGRCRGPREIRFAAAWERLPPRRTMNPPDPGALPVVFPTWPHELLRRVRGYRDARQLPGSLRPWQQLHFAAGFADLTLGGHVFGDETQLLLRLGFVFEMNRLEREEGFPGFFQIKILDAVLDRAAAADFQSSGDQGISRDMELGGRHFNADAHIAFQIAGSRHMELRLGGLGTDSDVSRRGDIDRTGRCPRTNPEGKLAAGRVSDKEIRFVSCHVPSLGAPARAAILGQSNRRCVPLQDLHVQPGGGCANPDVPGTDDPQRIRRRSGIHPKGNACRRAVLDREVIAATVCLVICDQAPVVAGEGASGGVIEVDPQIVLLQADGIGAEILVKDRIEAECPGPLHDKIVGNDLIGPGRGCE